MELDKSIEGDDDLERAAVEIGEIQERYLEIASEVGGQLAVG